MHLEDFKLERFFTLYEFSAKYILCSSDVESFSIKEILDLEKNSLEDLLNLKLKYTETNGNPDLREGITKLYKNINAENVLVHSGSQEGIFLFMNCALEKGDHVIVLHPSYQSLFEVAKSIGCEITFWKFQEDENNIFSLDLNFLKENIKKNTKALIINFPHNPTGFLPSEDFFKEVIKIVEEKNVFLYSDEVYRFLEHDEKDRLDAACDIYENAISNGSMSKAFGMPGLRIGWSVTKNKKLLNKMWAFKDYTSMCSAGPSEMLTLIALKNKEIIFKRNIELIKNNLLYLNNFFNIHKNIFSFSAPTATCISFPRFRSNIINGEDFCIDLVNKKNIFLLPSTKYDYGHSNFRLGFGKKNLKEALEKLSEYLATLKQKL